MSGALADYWKLRAEAEPIALRCALLDTVSNLAEARSAARHAFRSSGGFVWATAMLEGLFSLSL